VLAVQDCLRSCHEQMEHLLASSASKHGGNAASESSEPCSDLAMTPTSGTGAAPRTPTDAIDVLLAQ